MIHWLLKIGDCRLKIWGNKFRATNKKYLGEGIGHTLTIKNGKKVYTKNFYKRRVWHDTQGRPAFVIGNGRSRLKFDLETLRAKGTIYGCNALYRDFRPDYLVAKDKKICQEIAKNYPLHKRPCYTQKQNLELDKNFVLIPKGPDGIDMTTGMTAVHIAIHDGHTKIYLLGFDTTYVGKDKQYNHVYAGTNAYGPKTVDEDHSGFFAIRMFDFFNHFQNINFIRVGGKTVDMFAKCKNFTQLTYKEMADI
tara:strand:- start:99 stop:848 length:750 start_codon:yes stop_codon:yes gene_type:complete